MLSWQAFWTLTNSFSRTLWFPFSSVILLVLFVLYCYNNFHCYYKLTDTAETLLAKSEQHIETEIAIRRLFEVFQAPHMAAVLLQSGTVDT